MLNIKETTKYIFSMNTNGKLPDILKKYVLKIFAQKKTIAFFRKVRRVCDLYSDLPTKHRHLILRHLSENHDVDVESIRIQASHILEKIDNNSNYVQHFEEMRSALTPPYSWLFTRIGQLEGGVKFLVDMRSSTLELARNIDPHDTQLRMAIRKLFIIFFSYGKLLTYMLRMRQ